MPSGPGAFEGLIYETASLIASVEGTKICWPLGISRRGSPWVKLLMRNLFLFSYVGLFMGPLTLFRALYAWKNCIGLISRGTGSYG